MPIWWRLVGKLTPASTEGATLLAERTRMGLWVSLAATLVFGVAHLGIPPRVFATVYTLKATQLGLILLLFWALRGRPGRRRTLAVALLAVNGTYVLMAAGDVLAGNLETTPLLAVVCSLTVATLIPWGTGPQALTAVVLGLGTAITLSLSGRPAAALVDPASSVACALVISVYGARAFEHERAERHRVELALAQRARLEALRADVRVVTGAREDLRERLQACAEAIVRHLDAAFARIWTVGADGTMLELQASAGMYTHIDGAHARVRIGQLKIGKIAEERAPHLTNVVAEDPRIGDREWARRERLVSFAGYPLLIEGRLLGVVAMFARQPLGDETIDALRSVADAIALAVERTRSEEAQARLVTELERASRLKSEFVSTMSHELRTPLNVILGFAEMARDESFVPAQRDGFVLAIEKAGRQLLELVDDTLAIGKLDAGRDEARPEPVTLPAFWQRLGSGCATMPRKAGVVLEWGADAPDVVLTTDPRKITMVVRNLVSNALKFTEHGWVRTRLSIAADGVYLTVSDSGIGIRLEDQEAIFEMFRQADGSDARAFGGAGLGLYLVRQFVHQLGGTITLESLPGRGSTFTVKLPRITPGRVTAVA